MRRFLLTVTPCVEGHAQSTGNRDLIGEKSHVSRGTQRLGRPRPLPMSDDDCDLKQSWSI